MSMANAIAWPAFPRPRVTSRGPSPAGTPESGSPADIDEATTNEAKGGRKDLCGLSPSGIDAVSDPLDSHPLRSTVRDAHAGLGGARASHRDGEYAKFRAVLRKNFVLKTRGSQLWCTILEVLVPVAFIALMCLPRLFIADESVEMTCTARRPSKASRGAAASPADPPATARTDSSGRRTQTPTPSGSRSPPRSTCSAAEVS